MPDRMVTLKNPPPTAPYSAAKLLVWTETSWMRVHAGLHLRRGVREALIGSVLSLDVIGLRVARRAVDLHLRIRHVICPGNHVQHIIRIANAGAARCRRANSHRGSWVKRFES